VKELTPINIQIEFFDNECIIIIIIKNVLASCLADFETPKQASAQNNVGRLYMPL